MSTIESHGHLIAPKALPSKLPAVEKWLDVSFKGDSASRLDARNCEEPLEELMIKPVGTSRWPDGLDDLFFYQV